ncbi:uncharacterized protein METZ01_LOCUS298886 [marine metagenome]|uniref:Uncharacterized protein n=1 Tax=marine metagenome TaxID=408172 RepID=A0A382MF23_9ZZZZ
MLVGYLTKLQKGSFKLLSSALGFRHWSSYIHSNTSPAIFSKNRELTRMLVGYEGFEPGPPPENKNGR